MAIENKALLPSNKDGDYAIEVDALAMIPKVLAWRLQESLRRLLKVLEIARNVAKYLVKKNTVWSYGIHIS